MELRGMEQKKSNLLYLIKIKRITSNKIEIYASGSLLLILWQGGNIVFKHQTRISLHTIKRISIEIPNMILLVVSRLSFKVEQEIN